MLFDNQKLNVNMSGKEYLDYMKYRDNKRMKMKDIRFFVFMAALLIIGLTGISAIQSIFTEPSTFTYTWKGVMMFLFIAAGLGWILHGTGFLLVRR